MKKYVALLFILCFLLASVPAFATTDGVGDGVIAHEDDVTDYSLALASADVSETSTEQSPGSLNEVTPSLFEQVFGSYEPYYDGYTISPNYGWIANAVVVIVVVYCFLRIVGGIIKC